MNQAKLARYIEISSMALNQIESGKTPAPGLSRTIGIVQVLGISTNAFILGCTDEDDVPSLQPTKHQRTCVTAPVD
jgi:DNA-binding XRE family transcriptional regulator